MISAIVGLDTQATMNLETTIKGFTLTHVQESAKSLWRFALSRLPTMCSLRLSAFLTFGKRTITPAFRVALEANYLPISVPLTVDVTTGDMITPREVEYTFSLLFDDRTISILAYNLETVLAEKLETIMSRNIANTRPRDYYDVHILYALRGV